MNKILYVLLIGIANVYSVNSIAATLTLGIPSQPPLSSIKTHNYQTLNTASGTAVSGSGGYSTNDGRGNHLVDNHVWTLSTDMDTSIASMQVAHAHWTPYPLSYVKLFDVNDTNNPVAVGTMIAGTKNFMLTAFLSQITTYELHIGVNGEGTYDLNVLATPIPAAAWLFGSGFLGLLHFGRRRTA